MTNINHGSRGTEFLVKVLEQAQTGISVYDRDGQILYANQRYADMVGATADEIEGVHIASISPTVDPEDFDAYWESFAEGEIRKADARYQTLDGDRTFPVSVTTVHTTIDGQTCHISAVRNISRRKARERELRRYERLIENIPVAVYRTTPGSQGEFKLVNQGFLDIFNAESKEEVKNAQVADIYTKPAQRAEFSQRLLERGSVNGLTLELETFDGSPIWCEVTGVAVEMDSETVFELIIQDVTERKEYQRKLRLFEAAVEQAGSAIVITDRNGIIEYINPAFERETGYDKETAIGETPALLRSDRQDDSFYEELWDTILSGEVWDAELINQRKSGELYYARHTIAPITDDDGEVTHFVGIQSDVTERKLREKRLTELARILRHNLRNTVTALKGHAELLEESVPEGQKPRLDRILRQIDSLAATTEKATEIRKLLNKDYSTDWTCDLQFLLQDLVPEFRDKYPDVTFTIQSAAATVDVDSDICRTLLTELVDNAVIHNDQDAPEVTITVERPDDTADHVKLRVADNGPGISPQEKVAINIDTEEPLTHSSGIGLSRVNWIVTEYGGEVTITENTPRGSVVVLLLPYAE